MVGVLALLNLGVFAAEVWLGKDLDGFIRRWGLVPSDMSAGSPAAVVTLLTSMFLHAGWLHLIMNLIYLVVFGGAVEQRLGASRFMLVYLASGLAGSLVYLLAQPNSDVPAIGASGAIAGLIAAHLRLFPGATIGSVAPVLFFQRAESMPALLLLLVWVVAQLFSGVASITSTTGLAWSAHAGGFVTGLVLASFLRPRYASRR
jgi:membrane associated rhomboid family serine protease